MDKKKITIVSGLPRSGTSMMMQMLDAGGLEILTDNKREADKNNPKGYYEYSRVKGIAKDNKWLKKALNKAVKIVSPLLEHINLDYDYKIIFMTRDIGEIIASQNKMAGDKKISRKVLREHLHDIHFWLTMKELDVLAIDYSEAVKKPVKVASQVNAFLDNKLDVKKMAEVVDPQLYRNR